MCARSTEAQKMRSCTLYLANGDRMKATLTEIRAGVVYIRPLVAPENLLKLDLKKVQRIDFGTQRLKPKSAKGDVLRLDDDSKLRGRFIRLTQKSVRFELEDGGDVVELPVGTIGELGMNL